MVVKPCLVQFFITRVGLDSELAILKELAALQAVEAIGERSYSRELGASWGCWGWHPARRSARAGEFYRPAFHSEVTQLVLIGIQDDFAAMAPSHDTLVRNANLEIEDY